MLILNKISKKLGDFHLTDINLEISEGTYYVLLGRSGSGKTQLLELIAGLNRPDSGEIWLDGENITSKKLQKRGIGLVFQDYAIFPNMTVFGNIAYSLNSGKTDKKMVKERVDKVAAELEYFSSSRKKYTSSVRRRTSESGTGPYTYNFTKAASA